MLVLIIEDDAGITELIKKELCSQGHDVISCLSGSEAIDYLQTKSPDIILLDYGLPDINGIEFIQILTKKKIPVPPFVVSTGQGDERIAVEMMKLGARDYIVKDIHFLDLLPEVIMRITHDLENEKKRMEAEEKLFESKERYKLLHQSAGIAVRYYSEDCQVITYNDIALENIQKNKSEVVGKSLCDLYSKDEAEKFCQRIQKTIKKNQTLKFEDEIDLQAGKKYFMSIYSLVKKSTGDLQGVQIMSADITEIKIAQQQLEKTLLEKETLLRELYHRTKNNMQVIISLLDLQALYIDKPEVNKAFEETKNRIYSMALVHKMLYKTNDLSRINLKEYIIDIMEHLMSGYNIYQSQIKFVPDLVDVWVLIDAAIPCGLILNELISNVLKHAFPQNKKGEITIKLARGKNEEIEIHVSDNGVGLPSEFDIEKSNSLGLKNILSLGRHQLSGSIECKSLNGVTWILKFSDSNYRERV